MGLEDVAARVAVNGLARDRLVEVGAGLRELLPCAGLQRGSTVALSGPSQATAALALEVLARPTSAGMWAAVVGSASLGMEAASELGVRLDHLVLVPSPGRQWAVVTSALLGGLDLVVVWPPVTAGATESRRLAARARERNAVLMVVGRWGDGVDIRLSVTSLHCQGLGQGHGHLRSRVLEVESSGRRVAGPRRNVTIWLPTADADADATATADADAGAGANVSLEGAKDRATSLAS